MPASAFSPNRPGLVVRPRLVPNRTLGTTATMRLQQQVQKPFEHLVAEAFDGPVLRLSRRIKLLETAEERQIRRGDALDAIETVRREIEARHAIRPPSKALNFAKHFAAFATVYALVALAWCALI
jgi:hypothetical protein